jgi:hypothetical protein
LWLSGSSWVKVLGESHCSKGRPSIEHWMNASGLSALNSNVALLLSLMSGGAFVIITTGVASRLAATTKMPSSSTSAAHTRPASGSLVVVRSVHSLPSQWRIRARPPSA